MAVSLAPVNLSTASVLVCPTRIAVVPLPKALADVKAKVPAFTKMLEVDAELSPESNKVPEPALSRSPLPEIVLENSVVMLFTVKVFAPAPPATSPVKVRLPVPVAPKSMLCAKLMAFPMVRSVASDDRIIAVVESNLNPPVPSALLCPIAKVPPSMSTPPVNVLLPESTHVPVPALSTFTVAPRTELSTMVPEMVLLPVLLPVSVRVLAAMALVPASLKVALSNVSTPVPLFVMVPLPVAVPRFPFPMRIWRLMVALLDPVNSSTPLVVVWPRRTAPVPVPRLFAALIESVPPLMLTA